MFAFFVFLLFPVLAFAMPCGVETLCSSVSPGYVGLCLGDYDILYAFVDYGYGNIQLQNTGIQCDAVLSSGPSLALVYDFSAVEVLSYVLMTACALFSFLFGFSGGVK